MDVTASTGHRLRVGLFSGACLALGWAALSVLLGSSPAHADDSGGLLDGAGGLLGDASSAVASTVSGTASAVATTVDAVIAPVQNSVEALSPAASDGVGVAPGVVQDAGSSLVDAVASTPAVPDQVADVVTDLGSTVSTAVPDALAPVSTVLASSPVSSLTAPVTASLASVPVVGGATTELGVPALIDRVGGAVDGVTGSLAPVLGGLSPAIPPGVPPTDPGDASAPVASGTGPLASASTVPPPTTAVVAASSAGPPVRAIDGSAGVARNALGASGPPPSASSPPSAPTAPNAPDPWATPAGTGTSSSSAGTGGGSAPWFATISALTASAPHLSVPAGGAADDALPASPVFATDVSPD